MWAFLSSPWALATGLIMLSPALLAFFYIGNTDFRNFINYTRVSMNVAETSHWLIREAYPGQYFDQPIDFQFASQEPTHLYLLERPGRLYRVITAPTWKQELMLDIRDQVGGTRLENGALSFALHPDFGRAQSPNKGFVYVYYTHAQPDAQRNRLSRFDLRLPDVAQRVSSETRFIEQDRIPSGFHNGGTVLFGPDGFLYLSLGNFGDRMNPQKVDTIAGSILRLDVDQRGGSTSTPIKRQPAGGTTAHYFIPTDNPFYGSPEALEELWAIGLRNPFRMAFDSDTGDLWLGDVGDEWYEEVNQMTAGSNGQSPFQEGLFLTPYSRPKTVWGQELLPYYFYRQSSLDRAVIGGLVYRGEAYPELNGHYIFADNQSGILRSLDLRQTVPEPIALTRVNQLGQYGITAIKSTPNDEIYISILGSPERASGQILRLVGSDMPQVASTSAVPSDSPTYEAVSSKYDMLCARCHGIDGKGEGLAALAQRPNFTQKAWQQRVSDEYIKTVINKGGAAMGLSGQMPSWANAFTADELDLMVKKLRSFGNGATPKTPSH